MSVHNQRLSERAWFEANAGRSYRPRPTRAGEQGGGRVVIIHQLCPGSLLRLYLDIGDDPLPDDDDTLRQIFDDARGGVPPTGSSADSSNCSVGRRNDPGRFRAAEQLARRDRRRAAPGLEMARRGGTSGASSDRAASSSTGERGCGTRNRPARVAPRFS